MSSTWSRTRPNISRNGYLEPLDNLVDWSKIYDWARAVWTHDGKTWGLPQEAYTNELYYNKALLAKLGTTLPDNAQLTQGQFLDLVKKARAADITPIAQGVGDRPYPGAFIIGEALLRKLGTDDYGKLLQRPATLRRSARRRGLHLGQAARRRRRLPEELHDAEARRIACHYFYQKPGALTLPMGSWYTGRAFVPVDKGGQPADFPLGIMQFPAMDGGACNQCKTLAVGRQLRHQCRQQAQGCRGRVPERDVDAGNGQAAGSRRSTCRPPSRPSASFTGPYAAYFTELMERQKGAKYFIGMPVDILTGQCKDTFTQVMNSGFPGGLLTVDDAVKMMNQGLLQGLGGSQSPARRFGPPRRSASACADRRPHRYDVCPTCLIRRCRAQRRPGPLGRATRDTHPSSAPALLLYVAFIVYPGPAHFL